ncbi:Peptidyl-prolyl cis-trans isomerase-like 3, partial [Dufourea novaeangliae]
HAIRLLLSWIVWIWAGCKRDNWSLNRRWISLLRRLNTGAWWHSHATLYVRTGSLHQLGIAHVTATYSQYLIWIVRQTYWIWLRGRWRLKMWSFRSNSANGLRRRFHTCRHQRIRRGTDKNCIWIVTELLILSKRWSSSCSLQKECMSRESTFGEQFLSYQTLCYFFLYFQQQQKMHLIVYVRGLSCGVERRWTQRSLQTDRRMTDRTLTCSDWAWPGNCRTRLTATAPRGLLLRLHLRGNQLRIRQRVSIFPQGTCAHDPLYRVDRDHDLLNPGGRLVENLILTDHENLCCISNRLGFHVIHGSRISHLSSRTARRKTGLDLWSPFRAPNRVPGFERVSVTLHTDVGDIKIELFCELCPKTCENFLALCASDYYDNCLFHRNIKGFIVQTGDPTQTGKGGTSIWNRKFEDEFKEELKHNTRGLVSMANNGPNTNGSQFFITYAAQPHLDLKYTLFGKVIDGLETLEQLEKLPVNPKNYKPLTEIRINSVTIHANPLAG